MLHVILQILAIIGIALLCILGLLILLILLILFVPIRYRAEGNKNGGDIGLKVRVSYLLRLITIRFVYPEPGSVIVRLFGIKIVDTAKKSKEKKDKKSQKKKKYAYDSHDETRAAPVTEEAAVGSGTETEEAEIKKVQTDAVKTEAADESAAADDNAAMDENAAADESAAAKDTDVKKEKLSFRDKIQKIGYTIRNFCDKIKHIKDTIKEIAENISYYKRVITQAENKKLYGRAKDRIFKVLKSIRPRVLKASLHVGTGSPDTTGYLCALYGMLLPVLGNHVILEADFEKAIWEGEFFLKGRITIFTLLRHAVGLLLDKQLRVLVKQLKREE